MSHFLIQVITSQESPKSRKIHVVQTYGPYLSGRSDEKLRAMANISKAGGSGPLTDSPTFKISSGLEIIEAALDDRTEREDIYG
jgi:hypothetical protein